METLASELARLPHPERIARVLDAGRQVRGDRATAEQLEALRLGGTFDRWMALKSCYTSRDGALVLASTQDPSVRIRNAARKLVALACDDDQAMTALRLAFATRQHAKLLQALRRHGRLRVVDAFLDWLREQPGETRFADAVPYGSVAGVTRHLDRALERAGFAFWDRLRRLAPGTMASVLRAQLAATDGHPDSRLRVLIERSLGELASRAPHEAIALWLLLAERGVPVSPRVALTLARCAPGPMLDLALQGQSLPPGAFEPIVAELSPDRLLALLARDPSLLDSPDRVLARRPASERAAIALAWSRSGKLVPRQGDALLPHLGAHPAERERVYQAWSHAARNQDGVIDQGRVEALPADLGEREARRHLHEVTQLATRPEVRLPYAALLPWDDARAALADYVGHPEGEVRGPAVATLLRLAGRRAAQQPALVDEALAMVRARRNEQDPVRLRMVGALVSWPRTAWRREHLDAVGQIVRDGLDAADLSHTTARFLEELVLRLFSLDGAWGATWLTTLIRERGHLHDTRLGKLLSDDEVRACAAPLLELATAWSRHERSPALLSLSQSLGGRLTLVTGLPGLLEGVLASRSPHAPKVAVLALFAAHDRPRYERCLPGVLREWLASSPTLTHVNQLARAVTVLDDELAEGLAEVAACGHVIGLVEDALRQLCERRRDVFVRVGPALLARDASYILAPTLLWLAHRRRQDLLTPYLDGAVVEGRFASGKTGWLLPVTDGFERWSPDQHARYQRTLGRVCADHQRDTPTIGWGILRLQSLAYADGAPLLAMASDDRAAIQEMSLRALGRLDAGQGIPTLLGCMDDPRARIAIYALRRALLQMPPSSAVALLRQVPLRKVTVAKEVTRLLGELNTEEAFQALLAISREPVHRDVRLALLRALWDHLERDESWAILTEAALGADWVMASRVGDIPPDRLSDRSERRLSGLLARVLDRPEPEARLDLLRRAASLPIRDHDRLFYRQVLRRMESPYDDEIVAAVAAAVARATERDIDALVAQIVEVSLHRKVLQGVLLALTAPTHARSSVAREASRRALVRLADDPLLVDLHARVAARVLTVDELLADLDRLVGRGWLDEFPHVARTALGELSFEALERAERALSTRPHHALRQAALAALVRLAAHHGWTPALRQRLDAYQRDPSPRVAITAQFLFPPREEPPAPAPAGREGEQRADHDVVSTM